MVAAALIAKHAPVTRRARSPRSTGIFLIAIGALRSNHRMLASTQTLIASDIEEVREQAVEVRGPVDRRNHLSDTVRGDA